MPPLAFVSVTLPVVVALIEPVPLRLLGPLRPLVIRIAPPAVVALAMPRPVDSLTVSVAEALVTLALSVWMLVLTATEFWAAIVSTLAVIWPGALLKRTPPFAAETITLPPPALIEPGPPRLASVSVASVRESVPPFRTTFADPIERLAPVGKFRSGL